MTQSNFLTPVSLVFLTVCGETKAATPTLELSSVVVCGERKVSTPTFELSSVVTVGATNPLSALIRKFSRVICDLGNWVRLTPGVVVLTFYQRFSFFNPRTFCRGGVIKSGFIIKPFKT